MAFSRLMVITAAVTMFFALTLGLFPAQALGAVGSFPGTQVLLLMRFVGAMAFGIALLGWFGRNIVDRQARRAFSLAAAGGSGAAFAVFLFAMLSGPANPRGWILVAIAAAFCLAYAFSFAAAKARTA